jgi:DNA (cytosine-5)-methyltransferase 1
MQQLALSLFPGAGLLDRAFEEEGFTIVRGPDLLWGGDIKRFHPPAGRFDGIIGGTPCQRFSALAGVIKAVHGEASLAPDCIPEFERVIEEGQPDWFVMENVERAPLPAVNGYQVHGSLLNARWLGELQNRLHRFSFGTRDGRKLHFETVPFEPIDFEPRVCTNSGGRRAKLVYDATGRPRGKQGHADDKRLRGRSVERMCELQGLPPDFFAHSPFTKTAQQKMLGNGVPLAMGRALAKAVRRAIEPIPHLQAAE